MKLKLAALLVGMLMAATGAAQAQTPAYGSGLKERYEIPAPIPENGAIAVPNVNPIPEGFTYYLRADIGWGFAGDRSYSEAGRTYGGGPAPFIDVTTFGFGSPANFLTSSNGSSDVFLGTVGMGAYFTRHIRGDLTLDFRGNQGLDQANTYQYVSNSSANLITGVARDHFELRGAVGLANLYVDLLPRGWFTPYVGAGVGFVYNDVSRTYTSVETEQTGLPPLPTSTVTGSSKERGVALAAALMAGASFALNQSWMLDVNYRALYLGGFDVNTPLVAIAGTNSRAEIGDTWEQQVRIGLRYNIW